MKPILLCISIWCNRYVQSIQRIVHSIVCKGRGYPWIGTPRQPVHPLTGDRSPYRSAISREISISREIEVMFKANSRNDGNMLGMVRLNVGSGSLFINTGRKLTITYFADIWRSNPIFFQRLCGHSVWGGFVFSPKGKHFETLSRLPRDTAFPRSPLCPGMYNGRMKSETTGLRVIRGLQAFRLSRYSCCLG